MTDEFQKITLDKLDDILVFVKECLETVKSIDKNLVGLLERCVLKAQHSESTSNPTSKVITTIVITIIMFHNVMRLELSIIKLFFITQCNIEVSDSGFFLLFSLHFENDCILIPDFE